MKQKDQNIKKRTAARTLPLRDGGVFSWRFVAVLSLMGCIAIEILFNLLPVDHDTLLLFWFYPASLLLVAQLYFNLRFAKHFEIKLLLAFLAWSCTTVMLNFRRAQLVDSYGWFASACTTIFLCFSLPYAFTKDGAKRVITLLAITTVVSVTLLSVLSLIAVYATDIAAKVPSVFEGIGITAGRLGIDTHPNRSATGLAAAVILAGYLIAQTKQAWRRIAWALCGVICFVPLALTVSRTAIIAAGIGVGFEVFLALQVSLQEKMRAALRWVLSTLAACLVIVALYQGATMVGQASNDMIARLEPVAIAQAQQSTDTQETEAPAALESGDSVFVPRDLSDADSLNGRTDIWLGVWNGLLENPKILAFGTGPMVAGELMIPYFPVGSPLGLFHNSLLGTLVSFGVVGLLFVLAFLVLVAVSAFKLSFGNLKSAETLAVRMLPAMLLFAVAEGMMEDFLFAYGSLNIVWIWLMIAAGFVLRMGKQEPETIEDAAKL